VDSEDARYRLGMLKEHLAGISKRDPEQEVKGMALPVLDAVIAAARQFVKEDDPVLDAIRDVVVEVAETGEPIRAVDALLVVNQLLAAIPQAPMDLDTGIDVHFGSREGWFDEPPRGPSW
jgi:hypothetical protein